MNICNKKYKAILLIFLAVVLYSFAQSGDAFSAGEPLQNAAGDKAVTAAARAETVTLTLDEAVAYARAHSRTLKSADIDLEMAKRASDNAWNVFLPDVRATGTLNRTTDISSSIEQAKCARCDRGCGFRDAADFRNGKYALGGCRELERGTEFKPCVHRSNTCGKGGLRRRQNHAGTNRAKNDYQY
nr:TolC family protein [Treponema socranskii]